MTIGKLDKWSNLIGVTFKMKRISTFFPSMELPNWTWATRKVSPLPYHVILFLLLYINTQCKKSAPPPNILPPMTQEGKNTFGCKINGEVWIPYYQCGLINFLTKCEELHTNVVKVDSTINLPLDFELSTSREIKTGGTFSSFTIGAIVL